MSDGVPDRATVEQIYDDLDFHHGLQAFPSGIQSVYMASWLEMTFVDASCVFTDTTHGIGFEIREAIDSVMQVRRVATDAEQLCDGATPGQPALADAPRSIHAAVTRDRGEGPASRSRPWAANAS